MTIVYNTLPELQFGFSIIFACIGFGFLLLYKVYNNTSSPMFLFLSFFMNSFGFLFWSGVVPLDKSVTYILGDVLHIAGFSLMVLGSLSFTNIRLNKLHLIPLCFLLLIIYLLAILNLLGNENVSAIILKYIRAVPIALCGLVLVLIKKDDEIVGRKIAGFSFILWGCFIAVSVIIKISGLIYYATLIGMQMLAAFGMVAMVVNRIKIKNEKNERLLYKLEGILPICCYCKKIRDSDNTWKILEEYIESKSDASFSHGICPDCFEKQKPDH